MMWTHTAVAQPVQMQHTARITLSMFEAGERPAPYEGGRHLIAPASLARTVASRLESLQIACVAFDEQELVRARQSSRSLASSNRAVRMIQRIARQGCIVLVHSGDETAGNLDVFLTSDRCHEAYDPEREITCFSFALRNSRWTVEGNRMLSTDADDIVRAILLTVSNASETGASWRRCA